MGLCSDAPDYPKEVMRENIAAQKELGDRYLDQSQQQQDYWQNMWDTFMLPQLEQTLGIQNTIQKERLRQGRQDRARYQEVYQPLEDSLIAEFQNYDTVERRAAEAGRAKAAVQQSFRSQRENAEQRLSSYGIDPSQIRSGALDLAARVNVAAAQAQAGTDAARRVEDVGRSLRAEAINIGRGMPSNVASAYGQSLNAGNSAVGNANATFGQGANVLGTGAQWGQMAGNQYAQQGNAINQMYTGQLAGYEAGGGAMGALGNIAGQAFGAWAGSGFAEGGGAVGNYAEGGGQAAPLQNSDLSSTPGPNDNIQLTVAQDEYIIPKDVVMRMGTEKLDKMVEKTRADAGERGGANARTPAGEMPNPEPPIHGQTMAAEGGGSVGYIPPTPIAVNPQMPPPYVPGPDPYANYQARRAATEDAIPSMDQAIQMGAAVQKNYEAGEGLPGVLKDWMARRQTVQQGKVAMEGIPSNLGTSGTAPQGGGGMMGKQAVR